jgi:O-antigen/teichoic acid export membrane protein
LIGALVIGLAISLAVPLAHFFHVPEGQVSSFKNMIWLVGIAAGIGFPRRLFDAILMAQERFVIANLLDSSLLILRGVAMFAVLYFGAGLEGIGIVELGTEILNVTCKLVAAFRLTSNLTISFAAADRRMAWALFSFAFFTFITLLGDALRFNVQSLVLGRFLDLQAVGVYGIAAVLVRLLLRASSACTVVTFPRLSLLGGGDLDGFRRNYMKYSEMTALVVVGLGIELVLLSPNFIIFWVGEPFREAIPVAIILSAALSVDYVTGVSVNALKALNRQRFLAVQTILEGTANLLLSMYLVAKMGLIGIAWGTAIPILICKLFIQPGYSCRIIGVRLWDYVMTVMVKPMMLGAVVVSIFLLTGLFENSGLMAGIVLKGILIMGSYGILVR